MAWFSSELHVRPQPVGIQTFVLDDNEMLKSFLSVDTMLAPIVVPTQAGNSKGPEHAHANAHQVHPEGITTLATAIIPFSGRAVPTTVIVSLVPLHLGTGQV
jgi:hypothetical protein